MPNLCVPKPAIEAACKVYEKSPGIEHLGFFLLAGCEVFHLHEGLMVVNVLLFVSGGLAIHYDHRCKVREARAKDTATALAKISE